MKKFEGSSPFVRFEESPDKSGAFPLSHESEAGRPAPKLAWSAHFENS
jgi:hypothetical protein